LAKLKLEVESETVEAIPVPERATVCGLPGALSVILTEAVRLPVTKGLKVTLAVQSAPGASELLHPLLRRKSAASGPVTLTLAIVKVALPVLVSVTLWEALAVPTACLPNVRPAALVATPGVAIGVTDPPPPPQEVNEMEKIMPAAARIAVVVRRR
jgi:hypothetical protein